MLEVTASFSFENNDELKIDLVVEWSIMDVLLLILVVVIELLEYHDQIDRYFHVVQ